MKISSLIRNSFTCGEVRLGGMRPSWARQMYCVNLSYPPPPPPHMVNPNLGGYIQMHSRAAFVGCHY
jgi:hypothetical protein